MSAAIEARGLMRRYDRVTALAGIDLTVDAGAYCVLLGPSGCGKTTLLSILGGFADPDEGTLAIGGAPMRGVPAAHRPTATVFQDYALFPHMSVVDNVGFGLRMRGMPRRARYARAAEMLALVGLPDAGARRPAQLSGGQRQRVALARALAVAPQVLLLDEPLGALDLSLRRAMQDELKTLQRRVGATFVHVTHDQEEALALADHLVVMQAGRIADQGPPERLYRAPRSRFAAGFLGAMTFLPAEARAGRIETPFGPLRPTDLPDGPVTLGLRPEHVGPADAARTYSLGMATVTETQFQGAHRRLTVALDALPDRPLRALLPIGCDAAPGDRLALAADPAHAVTLPEPCP